MKKKIAFAIATWFGSGLVPPILLKGMAGTYGSIAALPLCWLVVWTYWHTGSVWPWVLAIAGVMWLGIWSVPIAEVELGPQTDWHGHTRRHDQNQIVIDEVLGMLVASIPMVLSRDFSPWWYLAILGAFRFFDITKFFPAYLFDHGDTAGDVMFDDFFAGLWAAIIVGRLMFWLK